MTTDGCGTGDVIEAASAGLENLAGAVTSVLGSAADLMGSVLDALSDVWDGYFGSPAPPPGTNWNAYTHEELYEMLWQDADVADVGAIAAEWERHGTALAGHADAVRDQRVALESNWEGAAAEQAAGRLGELRDRICDIGVRAGVVQRAAQDAGDALARARHAMPPPPGNPFGLGMGAGPDAMAAAGTSMFFTSGTAMGTKAEAVRVMQGFESSLLDSGHQIAPAPPGATEARAYRVDATDAAATSPAGYAGGGPFRGTEGAPGGVPWSRLVGGGGSLGPGLTGGIGTGGMNGALAAAGTLANSAARGGIGAGGFWPGAAARAGGDHDDEHRTRLPTVDHRLFTLDQRASSPIIGQ